MAHCWPSFLSIAAELLKKLMLNSGLPILSTNIEHDSRFRWHTAMMVVVFLVSKILYKSKTWFRYILTCVSALMSFKMWTFRINFIATTCVASMNFSQIFTDISGGYHFRHRMIAFQFCFRCSMDCTLFGIGLNRIVVGVIVLH